MATYTKLALGVDGIIALLKARGLVIKNEDEAKKQLEIINYFRLAFASVFHTFIRLTQNLDRIKIHPGEIQKIAGKTHVRVDIPMVNMKF